MVDVDNRRPKVASQLLWEQRQRNWVVIDAEKPAWAIVNQMGHEIIKLCTGAATVSSIARAVARKYGCKIADVYMDTHEFLAEMEKAGVVFYQAQEPKEPHYDEFHLRALFIEVTSQCNFRCSTCYVARQATTPDILDIKNIRSFVKSFLAAGGKEIVLTGGEPLLHPDFKELIGFTLDQDVRKIKVLTNGSLLNRDVVRLLTDDRLYIQVSLDGATAATNDLIRGQGRYELAITGIKNLADAGLGQRTIITMTPTKSNYSEAPQLIELAEKLGIKHIHFSRLSRQGRAQNKWKDMEISPFEHLTLYKLLQPYRERYRKSEEIKISGLYGNDFIEQISKKAPPTIGCDMGANIRVRADGRIFPCPRFDKLEYSVGDITDTDMIKVRERIYEIRALFPQRVQKISKCRACAFKYFCGSGCLADAVLARGSVWYADPSCDIRKVFYNYYIDTSLTTQRVSNE